MLLPDVGTGGKISEKLKLKLKKTLTNELRKIISCFECKPWD